MQKQLKYTDVADILQLLALAEEVQKSQEPRLLKRGHEAIALLTPVQSQPAAPKESRRRARTTSAVDPLWNIIGIADDYPPKDDAANVSENKYKYLAESYSDPHLPRQE